MESTLTINSPPSPYIVVEMESEMLIVLYVNTLAAGAAFGTQERRPGHPKRWNISCKDRCLRRPVEVFTRPRRGNGKGEAFASLSRARLGRHREINYHTPPATWTLAYTQSSMSKSNTGWIGTLTHIPIRCDTSYLVGAKDWWGHWTICTLHRPKSDVSFSSNNTEQPVPEAGKRQEHLHKEWKY